jgi:uncharacterized protein
MRYAKGWIHAICPLVALSGLCCTGVKSHPIPPIPMTLKRPMSIQITHNPSQAELEALGVSSWPIWTKEASEFPWTYDMSETCYLLAGDVIVTPDGGAPVQFGAGDLVIFPEGLSCTWKIRQDVRKHYRFG